MDNRLKFLYHVSSELWGHRRTTHPEMGMGQAEVGVRLGKSAVQSEDVTRSELK